MTWKRNVKNEMIMLSHVVKEKQAFGKKLATSPNGEKPATSKKQKKERTNTQNQNKRKKIPLKTTQNMPRCNALQR